MIIHIDNPTGMLIGILAGGLMSISCSISSILSVFLSSRKMVTGVIEYAKEAYHETETYRERVLELETENARLDLLLSVTGSSLNSMRQGYELTFMRNESVRDTPDFVDAQCNPETEIQ